MTEAEMKNVKMSDTSMEYRTPSSEKEGKPNAEHDFPDHGERQKKNRKGTVTLTVIGNDNSVIWRLYFYPHGEKSRCIGKDFFNWLPAFP